MKRKKTKKLVKKKLSPKAAKTSTTVLKQLTTKSTEADLEAEIRAALRHVFPWIPAADLKHQTKFRFQLGHAVITVDGKKAHRAEGRADIIIEARGVPLAVMELKRRGIALTPDDARQGLSYARVLTQMPPLVVVTNGDDTQLFETHSGQEWKPAGDLDAEFAKLLDASGQAAAVDIKQAVEVLLGTGADIWVSAVRQATALLLAELSGAWSNSLLPFVPDFLVPRAATQEVLENLRGGARAVIVKGAPLAGKSSVLRELAVATEKSAEFAVLFIEADGHGVFQKLANLLGSTLAWPVSTDEVRAWLRRLSKAAGPAIVLAIDGPSPGNNDIRKDMDELCSGAYGKNVRIAVSMDDTVVSTYTTTADDRKLTAIGRAAKEVDVVLLSDVEFDSALKLLWRHRIHFINGARSAAELRAPSILRAIAAPFADDPRHVEGNGVATLPPLLGLNLIWYARSRFKSPDLRRKLREIAKAILKDSGDSTRPHALQLESVGLFVVRNQTLEEFLDRGDLESLVSSGILKRGVDPSGEALLYVRLSELLASELSRLIADELGKRIPKGEQEAAAWLVETAGTLTLGDIVAAQAVFEAAGTGVVTLNFINALVNTPPREEQVHPGEYAIHIPGRGIRRLHFQTDGSLVWTENGERTVIQPDLDEGLGYFIVDMSAWLILSHLASLPFEMESTDGNGRERVDPLLLLEIGTCPHVLRGPQNEPEKNATLVHDVPGHGSVVCHKFGIVEPVTLAITKLLASNWVEASDWISAAAGLGSFPLMMRIYIALQQIAAANFAKAAWATRMLNKVIKPALKNFPSLH